MNQTVFTETLFNQDSQQFQVGQENVRHKKFGDCEIVGLEVWKGKLFYYIRIEGSMMRIFVSGSQLEVKA